MMYERYSGSFLSRAGVVWECWIMQEADEAFGSVGELRFPADEPLTIEWEETSKEEPLCGSAATLTVVSPGDRTYADLYTVEPGRIRLDVYRGGALYWSGCLDPEFYEEPYSSGRGYDVTLTFSDFGILDRLRYNLTGYQTLSAIIADALDRSGILYGSVDWSAVSTLLTSGDMATPDNLQVRSDNFYDEDGEASTLEEALEGVLQPLAMRMVQKAGVVWIYDINGLYGTDGLGEVSWASTDQVMGVDKVANDARVTFSPYAASALTEEMEYEGDCSEDQENLTGDVPSDGTYFTYYADYGKHDDGNYKSFTIFLNRLGGALAYLAPECRYFHILPLFGGTETDGVAHWFYTGGHGSLKSGFPKRMMATKALQEHTVIMRTNRVYLPALGESAREGVLLLLTLEMLCDARYNYFTDASKYNEKDNDEDLADDAHTAFIPVQVKLYGDDGTEKLHYSNASMQSFTGDVVRLSQTLGEWLAGDSEWSDCLLQYYSATDFDDSPLRQWATNRQTVGTRFDTVYKSVLKLDPGQYIPYPPEGGWLEVSVLSDIYATDDWQGEDEFVLETPDVMDKVRWMLFKTPQVEIRRNSYLCAAPANEDVEYTGILNADAKEDIELDTIVGTMAEPQPGARGLLYNALTGEAVTELTRAGRTTQAEQLLIGTLYSQFAERRTTLSGTAGILPDGIGWYGDASQEGVRFMLLSEVQDAAADESEILMAEFRPDEYESEEG